METWKDVKGYEGHYQVSSCGRVKSVKRAYKTKKSWKTVPERIRIAVKTHGYLYCVLWKDGKHERFAIHRMVADAFLENPEGLPVVNHKDGNKENNNVSNLEWCTHSENSYHAFRTGLRKPYNMSGEHNPMYGKHQSASAKEKIAEVHRGRKHTEEARKKMSLRKTGVRFTEEHKRNLAASVSKAKKGARKMTDGNVKRFIRASEIDEYLKNGWTFTTPR